MHEHETNETVGMTEHAGAAAATAEETEESAHHNNNNKNHTYVHDRAHIFRRLVQ